jgi:hypothetical protein
MSKQSGQAGGGHVRPLLALHILLVFGLAGGWIYFCWDRDPQIAAGLRQGKDLEALMPLVELLVNDVLLGLGTVAIFAFGTGVYVHRAQQWIDGRGSGEAIALRGANLNEQAIAANPPTAKKR